MTFLLIKISNMLHNKSLLYITDAFFYSKMLKLFIINNLYIVNHYFTYIYLIYLLIFLHPILFCYMTLYFQILSY